MKRELYILALLALAVTVSSCEAKNDTGLQFLGFVACDQTSIPQGSGNVGEYQTGGNFDLMISELFGGTGYIVYPAVANSREDLSDPDLLMGNGNIIYLEGFDVEYHVPEGWLPIEKQRVKLTATLKPGDRLVAEIDLLPESVRQVLIKNYQENAYNPSAIRNPATYRWTGLDGDGNPIPCTNENASEVCMGYSCNTRDPMDPKAKGECSNSCTINTGCAHCVENFCLHPSEGNMFFCDTTPGGYGYCRRACSSYGAPCTWPWEGTPYEDQVSSVLPADQLPKLACSNAMCVPDSIQTCSAPGNCDIIQTNLNPNSQEEILVKVTAKGKDVSDDPIDGATLNFEIRVCYSCMISYNVKWCTETSDKYSQYQDEIGNKCKGLYTQDWPYECAFIPSCYSWFCPTE